MRSWLVATALTHVVAAKEQHAAIHSSRGVQHEIPLISDDVVVGAIMVMFLLLFAFGELSQRRSQMPFAQHARTEPSPSA